jgi:hypothetical protein
MVRNALSPRIFKLASSSFPIAQMTWEMISVQLKGIDTMGTLAFPTVPPILVLIRRF